MEYKLISLVVVDLITFIIARNYVYDQSYKNLFLKGIIKINQDCKKFNLDLLK